MRKQRWEIGILILMLQTRKPRGMQDPAQQPRAAELLSGEARSRPGGHRRALTAAAAEPDRMQGRNRATRQGHWIQPDVPGSCGTAGSVRSWGRHVHTGSTSRPTLPFLPLLSAAAPPPSPPPAPINHSVLCTRHTSEPWDLILAEKNTSLEFGIAFFFFFFKSFFVFFKYLFICLFIYLFMAVLGLHFCARAFSSCGKRGPLFIAVRGPLTIAASLVAEHRLQMRRLSNCGSRA